MNPTASDLPELHPDRPDTRASTFGEGNNIRSDLYSMLADLRSPLPEHWVLQGWGPGGMVGWLSPDATGVTVIDLARYRHLTMYHLAVDTLPIELDKTMAKINALKQSPHTCGDDAILPETDSVFRAKEWIREIYEDVTRVEAPWHKPHVAVDEDGEIMFEWWNREKALTVYVSQNEARYIKGWGIDIENEMEDGEASTSEIRRMLWKWLID